MTNVKMTKEEKELLRDFEKELAEFGVFVRDFEKKTEKQFVEIEKDFEKQKLDFEKLEAEIIAFEERHVEEIDSLAIKSLIKE